mmetsp:Transcript_44238/g.102197  ORF Transcript_44238/g.102197 Transcript_44238/m.102197 type:complete len:291 (+) Transcript_44238:98-970(+)
MPKADVTLLVTQAAPHNEDLWGLPAKPTHNVSRSNKLISEPTVVGRVCGCLWPRRCKHPPNLHSVVPVAATQVCDELGSRDLVVEAVSPLQEEPQLPPQTGANIGRKTLVLDLDETLVHSSFRVVKNADMVIDVELEGEHHHAFVRKRPGVDFFLCRVAEVYEVVVYTASVAKYADPLLDKLDTHNVVTHRLFREACTRYANGYVKDLSRLGRPLSDVIIIDNSPLCYALQPANAIPIKTWRYELDDRELLHLIPILLSLADVDSIPAVLEEVVWGEPKTPEDELPLTQA